MLIDEQVGDDKLMSNGPFTFTNYETNQGNIVGIRVQPETLTLTLNAVANEAPTGTPADGFPSAQTSQSRRAIGINARRVTCVYTAAATGDLPGLRITLPWLQLATFNALPRNATGTYGTEPVRLANTLGEEIN